MSKVSGINVYVEVNTGTEASPVWTKVGGQRNCSITFGLGDIDVTDKDSDGWEDRLAGMRSIEIEFDGFLIENNAGYVEMKKGFWDKKALHLRMTTPAKKYVGKWLLTEHPIEAPGDGAATVSFSLRSSGVIAEV